MIKNCYALIPCAGSGSRFGTELPKQYHNLLDRTVLDWTLSAFEMVQSIHKVYVICQPGDKCIDAYKARYNKVEVLRVGGDTRAKTVMNALEYCKFDDAWVMVHDAARCCIEPADIERLIGIVESYGDGAILASKAVDTLKSVNNGIVNGTIDRSSVYHAQTPQMFRADGLLTALRRSIDDNLAVTDEASAIEHVGEACRIVECGGYNFKITHPIDLKFAEAILRARFDNWSC